MVQCAGLAGGSIGDLAMGDLILVVSIFAIGTGFGYYLRDWISKKRRERYLKLKQSKRSRNTLGSYYLPRRRSNPDPSNLDRLG
jgi:hypothetical protein